MSEDESADQTEAPEGPPDEELAEAESPVGGNEITGPNDVLAAYFRSCGTVSLPFSENEEHPAAVRLKQHWTALIDAIAKLATQTACAKKWRKQSGGCACRACATRILWNPKKQKREDVAKRLLAEARTNPVTFLKELARPRNEDEQDDFLSDTLRKSARSLIAEMNEFTIRNIRLVVSVAMKWKSVCEGRLPFTDLINEGNIGLMKGVFLYDPFKVNPQNGKPYRFSTYATWWIRHAVSRAVQDKLRLVRLPVHLHDITSSINRTRGELFAELQKLPTDDELIERLLEKQAAKRLEAERSGKKLKTPPETDAWFRKKIEQVSKVPAEPISLDMRVSNDADDGDARLGDAVEIELGADEDPIRNLEKRDQHAAMMRFLGELKPNEADILRKRFGLDDDRERTLEEIGNEYGVSRERIRQLQEQALAKIRRKMARDDLDESNL